MVQAQLSILLDVVSPLYDMLMSPFYSTSARIMQTMGLGGRTGFLQYFVYSPRLILCWQLVKRYCLVSDFHTY